MRMRSWAVLALAITAVLSGPPTAWAQSVAAKGLIGKWEGEVQWQGTKAGEAGRTLVIDSVDEKDGKWIARGRYGVTGKGLGPVEIEVNDPASRPWIQFTTGANSRVRLDLVDPKNLTGTLTFAGASQRGNDRPIRLERKE